MTLKDRISALKEKYDAVTPRKYSEIMHRVTEELEKSNLKSRAPKIGEKAPDFSLKDTEGALVSLASLRERGAVVLSFFRGAW